jgi:hypothetical protein
MRKTMLILSFLVIAGSAVSAQQTIYVSAQGDEAERGLNEARPTTFPKALAQAMEGTARRIVITGAMDIKSNGMNKTTGGVFDFFDSVGNDKRKKALDEIVITGKPGATGAERAVLSAKGSGNAAVWARNCRIRFEHIDIESGEGKFGYGVYIPEGAQVTLGPGAVVRNNVSAGVFVSNGGTFVIDGGELINNNTGVYVEGTAALLNGAIKENTSSNGGGGVQISGGGRFTMSGGTISGNKTADTDYFSGGGVYITSGGLFSITGGTITGNRSHGAGGGVFVEVGGEFEQKGGTLNRNIGQGAASNVFREKK